MRGGEEKPYRNTKLEIKTSVFLFNDYSSIIKSNIPFTFYIFNFF